MIHALRVSTPLACAAVRVNAPRLAAVPPPFATPPLLLAGRPAALPRQAVRAFASRRGGGPDEEEKTWAEIASAFNKRS
jgi:hypothetical protein